jgi:chromate transporter
MAPLGTIAREWLRIGLIGFGGPPAHISLLRELVVEKYKWMDSREFEHANAACGLLPGPASTQLAIFTAYRVGGPVGAMVGGLGFVVPAVVMVIALAVLFLDSSAPTWVQGAGAGAGSAVAAVAVRAAWDLVGPSREHARESKAPEARWLAYVLIAAVAGATIGPYLVLVLLACGISELLFRTGPPRRASAAFLNPAPLAVLLTAAASIGGIGALAWVAFKVGALSYGGGFVIIPLMQENAVDTYHWMTDAQFLNAVALGQVTPGPITGTVAAVGYAAHGLGGALLASAVAFAPSFSFILLGGDRFERLRQNRHASAFLDGAGPAAIGAIFGAAIPLTLALQEEWQFAVLVAGAVALLVARRSIVTTLLGAAIVGVAVALLGAPLP